MMRPAIQLLIALLLGGCAGNAANDASNAGLPRDLAEADGLSPRRDESRALLPNGPTEADYPHLHNLLQASERIYSGGEPKDEEAFAELAKLGVRTVVSVDGARPNVDAAGRHGLRYVHIPIEYDGVSEKAAKMLTRLVREADGPFYVHCHHGTHRGPAAAAIACIADGAADGNAAIAILERAGTSKGYAGLWRDVEGFVPPSADATLPELVSVAEVGSLAAAMAQIDRASDNLKLCQAADWQAPTDHPDIAPAQEALLLKEGFRETVRQLGDSNDYDERFLTWMKEAEASVFALEAALKADDHDLVGAAFATVQNRCKRCHAEYRD